MDFGIGVCVGGWWVWLMGYRGYQTPAAIGITGGFVAAALVRWLL